MSDAGEKVVSIRPKSSGEDNGGGFDARLRAVEAGLAELNARMQYMATKEDIQKVKVWTLSGVLGGMAVAATVAVAVVKWLFP